MTGIISISLCLHSSARKSSPHFNMAQYI